MRRWHWGCVPVLLLVLILSAGSPAAFAYDETKATAGESAPCIDCHYPGAMANTGTRWGPHGGYTTTTTACETCHTIHDAPTDFNLLPGATIKATCLTCHDGTTAYGQGVYGAIEARLGPGSVGATHGIENVNVVPGGDPASGGSLPVTFSGPGGTMTCSDCHSPHGNDCVTPFYGERQRAYWWGLMTIQTQNRLLKRKPGAATTPVNDYGSDWCLACHAGRASGMTVLNHPVESLVTSSTPYTYRELPVFDGLEAFPSATTILSPFGSGREWDKAHYPFLWPSPRTPLQEGTYPICQQCHEDPRNVGSLVNGGTQAQPAFHAITQADGRIATDNPRFQNFPHETTTAAMLVETQDDLCLNCHPAEALP